MCTIRSRTNHLFLWRNTGTKAVILAPSAHPGYVSPLSDIIIKYLLCSILTLSNIECILDLFRGFEPSVEVGCVRCGHLRIVYSRGMGSITDVAA